MYKLQKELQLAHSIDIINITYIQFIYFSPQTSQNNIQHNFYLSNIHHCSWETATKLQLKELRKTETMFILSLKCPLNNLRVDGLFVGAVATGSACSGEQAADLAGSNAKSRAASAGLLLTGQTRGWPDQTTAAAAAAVARWIA
jgi:hypothetical protein